MTKLDTIIRGGRVATASDTVACDVGIRDGRIVALGEDLGAADEVIDARGRLVLPGGIDSHVHFAQPSGPGIVMADDFDSGTRAAAFGGNTLVMPFCMQQKGESLREAVKAYHAKADGQCHVDVSFHLVISDPTPKRARPGAAGPGGRRLHLVQGLHDLRGPDAHRHPAAGGVLHGARDRRARHGARGELRRHPLPHRAAGARRQAPRPGSTPPRGPSPWSARPRTAPSAWPSWSTCRS